MLDALWDVVVNGLLESYIVSYHIRSVLYNFLGMKIKPHSAIYPGCYISGNKISLGKNSYINRCCILDAKAERIFIGENVGIACATKILTTCHDYSNPQKRTGGYMVSKLLLEMVFGLEPEQPYSLVR